MKLRYKLNIFIIGLIVISILVPSVIYYHFSKDAIKEQVDGYLQLELTKNAYDITSWIETQSQAVIILDNLVQKNYVKEDITEELLHSYITSENVSDLYVGYDDGGFVSGIGWIAPAEYDPRIRPWYKEIMETGKLTVSNMYFDFTSNNYAVSIGMPLIDKNGKTIGVIAEDILLDSFYGKIQNIQLKNDGYAYLMDLNGNILVHRDKGLVGQNMNELTEGEVQIDLSQTSEGSLSYTYEGEKKLVVYDTLPGTKWILVLVAVEKAAYQPLNNLLFTFLGIAFVNIALALVLIGIFNRNIIHRLKLLSNASNALSNGIFDVEIEDMGNDEIGEVSTAFNRMKFEIGETISELNLSRANYEELVENTADIIYSVDANGYLITANSVFFERFFCDKNAINEVLFSELVQDDPLGIILIELFDEVLESKHLLNRKIDDLEQKYYNITLSPIFHHDSEELKGVTTIIHDVSDLELSRNHLEWITHHDPLTNLPNRLRLLEDMNTVILKARSGKGTFAVLLIDLDDFKNINDTMGYPVGDSILHRVAKMLSASYRTYRTGADEFVVILEDSNVISDLYEHVVQIAKMIHGNYEVELNTVFVSSTIGVVRYPNDFSNVNEMMVRMDATLNYAKANNRSDVQIYEHFISDELEKHVVLEKGLRHALTNNEFVMFLSTYYNRKYTNHKRIRSPHPLENGRWKHRKPRRIYAGRRKHASYA